jgi:GTP cyclohydrolase IA
MNFHPRDLNRARLCNETLDQPLAEAEREAMIAAAAHKLEELFDILRIDHRNDHNTRETPQRVAKMYVEELLEGRFTAPPKITEFDNAQGYDQLIVTGPIELRSMCAHHLMPIYGAAYIGILPAADGRIIGLSKYDRIVEYFASRLQIQEELVKQIGHYIMDMTSPRGWRCASARCTCARPSAACARATAAAWSTLTTGATWPRMLSSSASSCRNAPPSTVQIQRRPATPE